MASFAGNDHRISTETEVRNKAYLQLIFEHPVDVIEEVLCSTDGSYPLAYDELVRRQGHGTPGSSRQSAERTRKDVHPCPVASRHSKEFVPRMAQLTDTGHFGSDVGHDMSEKKRSVRAEELLYSFQNRTCSSREYWERMWGDEYEGFREVQKEVGVLRDDIVKGKIREDVCRHSLGYLRKHLNYMVRSSVGEWYKKWGELDLHRLSTRDAVELIHGHLKQPPWSEMRIVAGQRPHDGDDHQSEGILYDLIHCMFGDGGIYCDSGYTEEQVEMIKDIRRYARENRIAHCFYSNEAAVHLKKAKKERNGSGPPGFSRRRSPFSQI